MDRNKKIKCVVWDLDNTLWDGVLLESPHVRLKPKIKEIIQTLDSRGILHSISSKNDYELAISKLVEFGLDDFFLYPEIHWNAKSFSLENIHKNINIGMDAILFIDDQKFELEEVASVHSSINCLLADEYLTLLSDPRLQPRFITRDSKLRRQMYQNDFKRKEAETAYQGPSESFLASLDMKFLIHEAEEEDLQRAEELTIRTNQLNATGKTYHYEELNNFRRSKNYQLLLCELEDKYGTYGKIGLALINKQETYWKLEMMLMSCRVVSRGVGTILLSHIVQEADQKNMPLLAEFKNTGRNRMMYITFRFAGFYEKSSDKEQNILLEHDRKNIQKLPDYVKIFIKQS